MSKLLTSLVLLIIIDHAYSQNITYNSTEVLSWSNDSNITRHSFDNFPADYMPEKVRNAGGILMHILVLSYVCLGTGIICDRYFLPSLEIISQVLALPPDIAGATFMAMGTSAPDLFTSIIGVFISEDDIGTGTVLGAAVFNLIAIPAVCGYTVAFLCPRAPTITKFPILRDSIFYILAIVTLIISIKDNMVDLVESTILLVLFLIYLVLMYFNAKYSDQIENTIAGEDNPLHERSHHNWNKIRNILRSTISQYRRARIRSTKRIIFTEELGEEEKAWFEKIAFFKYLLFPMTLLFRISLPKPNKYLFPLTFILSIVWLGAFTYISVWMVTIIGYTIGIPDTVSGLTILAAANSMPDLIASVLVVKKAGKANMAISNSFGANIFGILFCLSVPWLLKSIIMAIRKGTVNLAATAVPIDSASLPLTTSSLLICVFALIITFYATHWKLGLSVAIVFSIIYLLFAATSACLEIFLA